MDPWIAGWGGIGGGGGDRYDGRPYYVTYVEVVTLLDRLQRESAQGVDFVASLGAPACSSAKKGF